MAFLYFFPSIELSFPPGATLEADVPKNTVILPKTTLSDALGLLHLPSVSPLIFSNPFTQPGLCREIYGASGRPLLSPVGFLQVV